MTITEIKTGKKQYLPLLLLADEQENMIDCYLDRGIMNVLEDDGVMAECVVTDEGDGILEIKNIAVDPAYQRRGCGKALIDFVTKQYAGTYAILQVARETALPRSRFTKNAVLPDPTSFAISLRTTMITQLSKTVCS